jgi:hypothetical protein
MTYKKLIAALFLCAAITANGNANPSWTMGLVADTAALENAYVKVYQNTSVFGAAHTEGIGSRVIVALNNVSIKSSKGDVRLERGQVAVFLANESYSKPVGEFFEVGFKLNHPPPKGPERWLEPTKNTIVYENEEFRIFEERLAGGDERPLHTHNQRVVVRLNEVQLTDPRIHRVPPPGTGIQVPNTVRFAEAMEHAVLNTSKIPLFNIIIEFQVPHSTQQSLFSDDFTRGTGQWIAEFENPLGSSVSAQNGVMDLQASAGATVWFKNKLSGNLTISYSVVVVDSGGTTDRVSDLNVFWMALDSSGNSPFGRNGKFSSYDNLRLYYAGIGGNENKTTRFRKYDPVKGKPVLQEFLDKKHLLEGNKSYSVRITVQNGRTTLFVNDTLFFDYADKQPLTEGYFAFRTTRSHQRISNFEVQQQ